jgi:ATP-dependent DNA ligase
VDWLQVGIEPMLLGHRTPVPTGDDWTYEVKWDGIRGIVIVDEGVVRIKTRCLRDVTPELCVPDAALVHDSAGHHRCIQAILLL